RVSDFHEADLGALGDDVEHPAPFRFAPAIARVLFAVEHDTGHGGVGVEQAGRQRAGDVAADLPDVPVLVLGQIEHFVQAAQFLHAFTQFALRALALGHVRDAAHQPHRGARLVANQAAVVFHVHVVTIPVTEAVFGLPELVAPANRRHVAVGDTL